MKRIIWSSFITLPFLIASCGGNQSHTSTTDSTVVSMPAEDTASAQEIAKEMSIKAIPGIDTVKQSNNIVLTGSDQMKYDVTVFKVKAGESVTLSFKNIGTQPKAAMGHNVVILTQGTDMEAFAQAAMADKTNDYIPQANAAEIVAHTKLLGPGESDKITFTLNDKGVYNFLCSFPGHHALMNGKIVAE